MIKIWFTNNGESSVVAAAKTMWKQNFTYCSHYALVIICPKMLRFCLDSLSTLSSFLCSLHPRNSCQNTLRPWRDMLGSHLTRTAKVTLHKFGDQFFFSRVIFFSLKKLNGSRIPLSVSQFKWCKPSSCHPFQRPSCLRMFSCCCSRWWWVSSSTYLHSSQDFLMLSASNWKNGLRGLHVAVINLRDNPLFEQWNNLFFSYLQSLINIY